MEKMIRKKITGCVFKLLTTTDCRDRCARKEGVQTVQRERKNIYMRLRWLHPSLVSSLSTLPRGKCFHTVNAVRRLHRRFQDFKKRRKKERGAGGDHNLSI